MRVQRCRSTLWSSRWFQLVACTHLLLLWSARLQSKASTLSSQITADYLARRLQEGLLPSPSSLAILPSPPGIPPNWRWDRYHHYNEFTNLLTSLSHAYPHVKKYSLGTSVRGRELWAAQITGDAAAGKLPVARRRKFKYVGNMHGDEMANRELLIRLIHHLATAYKQDARITALLDNTDIHILPSMNPDGFELIQRYNANNRDLNRNWPLNNSAYAPSGQLPPPPAGQSSAAYSAYMSTGAGPLQRENQLVMQWSRAHNFSLSANLHGGSLVANYPLDVCDVQGTVSPCPTTSDPLPLFLAQVYSYNHPLMSTNSQGAFSNGTVNGAFWYQVFGGMQDWMYYNTPGLELTLELHEVKQLPAAELPAMWQHNQQALLRYMEMVWLGLEAQVVDSITGSALAATVSITRPRGWRNTVRPVSAGPAQEGRFFLMLAPETLYCLRVQPSSAAASYQPVVVAAKLQGASAQLIHGKGLEGRTLRSTLRAVRRGAAAAEVPVKVAVGGAAAGSC